ncbi:hypothetical protein [Aurantimonas sp. 22II-16-19i]|uniref:hypothetical protein n=1 Tax=Aurantimonas sp. 22II-16-19i TaxID=1317114 RepID=UPI0009F7A572|nr:hypothetical protein [Aurantimonas sp. 22II-16-19i]ORE90976.1 hypothetical protein ATO4_19979 [Aurantimonas sp. 22II-16-19i]
MNARAEFPADYHPDLVAFVRARVKADPAGRLQLDRTYEALGGFLANLGRAGPPLPFAIFAAELAVMAASVGGGRFGDTVTGLAPIFSDPLADFFDAAFRARLGAMVSVETVKCLADEAGFTHREVLNFARARGHEIRRNAAGPDFLTDLALAEAAGDGGAA